MYTGLETVHESNSIDRKYKPWQDTQCRTDYISRALLELAVRLRYIYFNLRQQKQSSILEGILLATF